MSKPLPKSLHTVTVLYRLALAVLHKDNEHVQRALARQAAFERLGVVVDV